MWMHLRVVECCISFWGHCDLDLLSSIICSEHISYIMLYESQIWFVGTSWNFAYHFGVTMTLTFTSGLISRKIVSRAYHLYY